MNVCVIYHCNEWKEYSSRKLIGVVNENDIASALSKIQKECNYTDEELDQYIDYDTVELGDLDI